MIKKYQIMKYIIGFFILTYGWVGSQSTEGTPNGFESFQSTVSLNFKDAKLEDILRLLAVQNNLNVIVGSDVKGEVTVALNDVHLGTALDAVLKVNGYDWFVQENIIVIKPDDKEIMGELNTRIYKLDYVDASAVANALQNVLTTKGKAQVFSPVMKGGLVNLQSGGGQGGQNQGLGGGILSSLTGGGQSQSRGAQGGIGGGGQQIQQGFDHLLVTDYYANFTKIENIIQELDQQVAQVNIAVKFVETKLTEDEKLGIDWSMRSTLNLSPNKPSEDVLNIGKWEEMRIATLTLPVFSALLEIMASDGHTQLLQEPQVTVKDNVQANINVGTKIPILVPQTEGGLIGQQPNRFQDEEINITLTVLPKINEEKYISMDVQAVVNALVGYTAGGDRPIVSTRSTNTSVMVKNGETLLMGGLIFESVIETDTHLPVLAKIPLLKSFFKHKNDQKEQSELLLFITPNIITF